MKLQPLDDRVLIELQEEKETTRSGIIIPDSAKEKPRMGTVIAVGTDEDLKEVIKEGDSLLFAKYGGEDISLDGKDYIILQRSDILAIIKK